MYVACYSGLFGSSAWPVSLIIEGCLQFKGLDHKGPCTYGVWLHVCMVLTYNCKKFAIYCYGLTT